LKGIIVELKDIVEMGLKAQEAKLEKAIEKFEGQLKEKGNVDTEVKGEVRTLAEQFKELKDEIKDLSQKQNGYHSGQQELSIGEAFVKSAQFQALQAKSVERARIELPQNLVETKSTTINGTGTTFPFQRPGMIPGSFVPLTVRAAMRVIPVTTNAVNSLRENSWLNSAAEVSEGAAKNESDITFAPYDVPVRTIAHWLKISNQLLADAPAVVAYIETRLRDGLEQRIENQLLNGNASSPNLSGLTRVGNHTAYTPTSDDTLVDAINRIKYTMWATGNMPDTVIVNPATWGAMERLREFPVGSNGATGSYLYGAPGTNAGMNPFGLNVILSTYLNASKIIVGRFSDSAVLYERSGTVVEMGYQNADFTNNLITIRAEQRLGLGVDRPAGIYYGDWTTT
jgi:HK97 family phage major capsid protein